MQRYTNSAQTMRALIALLALTGNIGKPGAGWIYANLQSDIFSSIREPLALYPPEADDDPIRVSISTARLGPEMLEQRDPGAQGGVGRTRQSGDPEPPDIEGDSTPSAPSISGWWSTSS